MQVVVIHNAASGAGHAAPPSKRIVDRLMSAGHGVKTLDAGPALTTERLGGELSTAQLCVIVGGDGTLHYALPALMASRVPVYHVPFGTENLFAREFGMTRDPDRLLRAIAHDHVVEVDLGECNGRPFAIMCSVGFDSAIVERVAQVRATRPRGGVRKIDYVNRGLGELLRPRVPTMTIEVTGGGGPLVKRQTGMLVIANSRQYAARLDPARGASMTDGELDIVMYPHAGRLDLAGWMVLTALGLHTRRRGLVQARAKGLRVVVHGPILPPQQMDGESMSGDAGQMGTGAGERVLSVRVIERALRVLRP